MADTWRVVQAVKADDLRKSLLGAFKYRIRRASKPGELFTSFERSRGSGTIRLLRKREKSDKQPTRMEVMNDHGHLVRSVVAPNVILEIVERSQA